MGRLIAHLIRKLDPHRDRRGGSARLLASVTVLALVLGSVSPGWALAVEAESEGEGGGATPPGLGNPGLEPGGSETVLEALPGSSGGEEVEGDEVVPPVETEPAVEVPAPEAAATEEAPIETEVEAPAPSPAPASATPEYVPSPPAPTYETAPPPQAQPVENEAIVAPAGSAEPSHTSTDATQPKVSPPASPPIEEPAAPSPAPTPTAVLAPDPGARGPGRIPAGRTSYTVHPGDCLWSIAAALLPPGADEAQVAAEVATLWHLNAGRIGTGDPNLILVGTVLRLA